MKTEDESKLHGHEQTSLEKLVSPISVPVWGFQSLIATSSAHMPWTQPRGFNTAPHSKMWTNPPCRGSSLSVGQPLHLKVEGDGQKKKFFFMILHT